MKVIAQVMLIVMLLLVMSCSQPIDILNVAPSVTGVGPVVSDDGVVSIVFWVRDKEENAVDVFLEVVQGTLVTPITIFGGHGDVGLTTSRDATGRAHVVLWKAKQIDPTEQIRLRIQAQDDLGAPGPVFETEVFTLSDGLPPL